MRADGRTDGRTAVPTGERTDITKLVFAFRICFASDKKNCQILYKTKIVRANKCNGYITFNDAGTYFCASDCTFC